MSYQKCVRERLSEFVNSVNSAYCTGDAVDAGLLTVVIEMLAVIADELHEMNERQKAEKIQEKI